jgi:hypothetical protein
LAKTCCPRVVDAADDGEVVVAADVADEPEADGRTLATFELADATAVVEDVACATGAVDPAGTGAANRRMNAANRTVSCA